MFFIKTDHLPKELTTYDLLKSLAVILMIVDHVGAYIVPDQTWWRAVASSMPLWFFFAGYANTRNIPLVLWGGAIFLILADMLFGGYLLPVSILATIIFTRLLLAPIMKVAMYNVATLIVVSLVLAVLWYHTRIFTEYGALAILVAMFGWMVRREKTDTKVKAVMPAFTLYVIIVFLLTHFLTVSYEPLQSLSFIVTTLMIFGLGMMFKPQTLTGLSQKLPNLAVSSLKIMGRYSLYLYVGHVILFMIIAYFLDTRGYELMNWRFFP